MSPTLIAFTITLFAGLSTGIGSLIALIAKKSNATFLSSSLGFSAGVMLYVSFMELLPTALADFKKIYSPFYAELNLILALFGGIVFIAFIDYLVPKEDNPHEIKKVEDSTQKTTSLKRLGILTALSIGIHNFPEGMATFSSALHNPEIGLSIAIAIAIHNIPEGIAVSVPIFQATGSRKKAFWFSFLSGLSEPLGAVIGYFFIMQFMGSSVNSYILAATAGIMIFISLDELLPTARAFGKHHHAIIGLVLGMLVMALSLLMLR